MIKMGHGLAAFVVAIGVIAVPVRSTAQDVTTQKKWEVDAHIGILGRGSDVGTPRPLPGADGFITVTGAPSAAVSSWFFGTGAALFNQVNALTGTGATIVPLDQVLQAGIARRRGGFNTGFTVARWVTPRLAVQMQGDYAPNAVVMTDRTLAALEQTGNSYLEAWSRLFDAGLAADGVQSEVVVSSDPDRGGGHQLILTGGLKAVVHTRRLLRTYVAGAFGISRTWNRSPRAVLTGTYQFGARMPGPSGSVRVPFLEHEEVSIRADLGEPRTLLGSISGGFEYYTEFDRGVRVDVAVLLGPTTVTTFLDATPAVFVQDTPAVVAGTTTPTMQFSSHPADVIRSSLTGPSIRDLETSRTEGLRAQVKVSVGYFIRF